MKRKYKSLLKNLFLFSISSFFPKFLAIVLIPLYTSVLLPEEVATGEIINSTAWLATPILSLCMRDAVLRFCLDIKYSNKAVLSNAFLYQVVSTIILLIGCFIIYSLNIEGLQKNLIFFTGLMIFLNCVNDTINSFCRGIDNVSTITYASIINSLIILIANAIFLLIFKWGFDGYMIANCLGPLVSFIFICIRIKVWRYIQFLVDKKLLKTMLIYSSPIILSSLLNWVNGGAIKYILPFMIGLSASGLYTTCSKIPNLIGIVQTVFNSAWQISAVQELDRDDKDGFMGNVFHITLFALLVCSSFLMIINKPLAQVLFKGEFYTAYKYTAPLYVSMIFTMCSTYMDGIFISLKRTKIIAFTSLIGGIAIVVLLFGLVSILDIYGAAFATLIGNIVLFISKYIVLRKLISIKINIKIFILSMMLIFLQMILNVIFPEMFLFQIPFIVVVFVINKVYIKKSVILLKKYIYRKKRSHM